MPLLPATARLALACLLFFLSGSTALVYQVVWQRLLGLFTGTDVYAATITVAAFMAGLGCGSLAGGRAADRLSHRESLLAFAVAEMATGVFGWFSVPLFYDLLHVRLGHVAPEALMPLILFAGLLWPTFFMGTTLPLLARALTLTIEAAAPTLGVLYGVNALGAAAGAMLTTWWLLPRFGLEGSLTASAGTNLAVSVFAVILAIGTAPQGAPRPSDSTVPDREPTARGEGLALPAWIVLSGLSGFLALSLEIVWFRTIGVIAKSTAFTFGTSLGVYLFGLGLGASVGSLVARRIRQPTQAFLLLQTTIGIYVGLSTIVLLSSLETSPLLWLRDHLGAYNPLDLQDALLKGDVKVARLYLGIPAVLMGPPTLLMGISFPLLQKAAQQDLAALGSRLGRLMFANVAGSTGGAILTGWWALRVLGTADTLKALVTASAFFAIAGALLSLRPRARQWKSAAVFSIGLFAALTVARAMPSARALWAGLHGSTPERIVYGEDETGVSLLKVVGATAQRQSQVYVNGVGQSWIPYGQTHTILGALPAFLHPDPRDVVVIGLGSGDTAFALAGRDSVERITCVEIVKSQLRTLTEYDRVHGYEGLAALFRDPRVEHIAGDGRRFIMRAERQFDIIEADALRPLSAYSGNLYSDRYFELLRGRLKRGGLAVTWAPTARVRRTFLKVFSHAVSYRDILMGSVDPIVIDHWAARRRLADASVQQFYRAAGVDIEALLEPYLATTPERYEPGYDRSTIDDINTDLFPRDEFDVPPLIEWRSLRPANSAE